MKAGQNSSTALGRVFSSEMPLWAVWTILRSVALKVKSSLIGRIFHVPGLYFGPGCVVRGSKFIKIGKNFYVHGHLWMEAITTYQTQHFHPAVEIGENVSFSDGVHITCIDKISIGDGVLFGSRVYVSDHNHGYYKGEVQSHPSERPSQRQLGGGGAVKIEDDVWIGDNVVIVGPIHIGRGSIVAANSVVRSDVPDFTMVGGIPARTIRRFDVTMNRWEKP